MNHLTPIDMNGIRINSLGDPVDPQDAVTKQYADSLRLGSLAASKPAKVTPPVFSEMESGWINWYGGSIAFDTTNKISGDASLRVDIDAAQSFSGARLTQGPTDFSRSSLKIRFKFQSWTTLTHASLLLFTDTGLTTGYALNIRNFFATPADNEWIEVTFPRSAFEAIDANPDWRTVRDVFLRLDASSNTSFWVDEMSFVPDAPRPLVTISFDDGWDDTMIGAAYMDRYGYRGTAFIVPDDLGTTGFLTEDQLDTLSDRGWGIGGHWNANLGTLNPTELDDALKSVRGWLVNKGYRGADDFAYPNGYYNDAIKAATMRYFATARTIDGMNQPTGYIVEDKVNSRTISNLNTVAEIQGWIDSAIASNEWLILNFHQLVTTPTQDIEYSIAGFEDIIDYLNAKSVAVMPYHEVIALAAKEQLAKRTIQVKVFADDGTVTTGDGKAIFAIPDDMNGLELVSAQAYVTTVSSSGTVTVQIRNVTRSTDMLSTPITIDANETTSYTAATPSVVNTAQDFIATGNLIAIDVDGAGTGARGLGVILRFA